MNPLPVAGEANWHLRLNAVLGELQARLPNVGGGIYPAGAVVQDTATRADSALSAGAATETGQVWNPNGNTWGVAAGKLVHVTNGAGVRTALIDGGQVKLRWSADVTITNPACNGAGLVVAANDGNNSLHLFIHGNGTIRCELYTAGVFAATLFSSAPAGLGGAGTWNLAGKYEGDAAAGTLYCYLNNVLVQTHVVTNATARAMLAAATLGGLYSASAGWNSKWDNVKAETVDTFTDAKLLELVASEAYQMLVQTRDTDGFVTTATVKWPDGTGGVYTLVTKYTGKAIITRDAYTVTYPARNRKITQAVSVRDATTGEPTSTPALTIGAMP